VAASGSRVHDFSGYLLDSYGVFWGGGAVGALPGATGAMERLVDGGKIVGILSNSTQLASSEIEKLRKHQISLGAHFHFLITSGEIARSLFLKKELSFPTPRCTFYPFGENFEHLFQGTSYSASQLDSADFIYIGVPRIDKKDQTDPMVFQDAVKQLVSSKLPMVCANPDLFAHEGNPPQPMVRQGSIAKLYEEAGGTVYYIGKPASMGFEWAMSEFVQREISDRKRVLMVGDTPETDIRGARRFGIASALVTETGMMAERREKELPAGDSPDFMIRSLADAF